MERDRIKDLLLCNNLEGGMAGGGRKEVQEEGTCVYLWLIHGDMEEINTTL